MSNIDINHFSPYRQGQHEVFVSSENHCIHKAHNPNNNLIRQFKIDGEVFRKGTAPQRCDFLLVNDTKKLSYYIELKGSDIPKAIQQIDNTVAMIGPSLPDYEVFRRIVYRSSTHKVEESAVVKWKIKHKGRVLINRTQIEENIS